MNTNEEPVEINLTEIIIYFWKEKILISIVSAAFAIFSVFYALSIPDEYQSEIMLIPASSNNSNLASLAGNFGGLASLAGIDLGSVQGNNNSEVALELIKSWGFLETFINQNELAVPLFAGINWNKVSRELIIDDEMYDVINSKWIRTYDPSKGETPEPSSWELYEKLRDNITISKDRETGIVRVALMFYSPDLAKDWLDKLVRQLNQHFRDKDRAYSLNNINYLEKQISETNLKSMQTIFFQLIEEQTKNLMLSEANEEYVFRTVSESKVSTEKTKPQRALICIVITVFGFIMSLVVVFAKNTILNLREQL